MGLAGRGAPLGGRDPAVVKGVKKKLLDGLGLAGRGWAAVGVGDGWGRLGVGEGGRLAVGVGDATGREGVGDGEGTGARGVTEAGSGKFKGAKLVGDPAEGVGLWGRAKAVKGVGPGRFWGMGVAEKVVLDGVGVAGRLEAGVGVGLGRRPAGAAALLVRISPSPRMVCLRSVWKVPVSGLKTSSEEKLGPTGAGDAGAWPLSCLVAWSKVMAGRFKVNPSSSSSKSNCPAGGAAAWGRGLGRDTGRLGRGVGGRVASRSSSAIVRRFWNAFP